MAVLLDLFESYPWGSWDQFCDTPRWVKDRAWERTQALRAADNRRTAKHAKG